MRRVWPGYALWLAGSGLLFAIGMTYAGMSKGGDEAPKSSVSVEVSPSTSATLCLETTSSLKAALQAGKQRQVLVLTSYEPPESGGASLVVTAVGTGKQSVLGLFPGTPFKGHSPESFRRFFLPKGLNAGAEDECYEVALQPFEGTSTRAAATVTLEIVPEPNN